MPRGVAIKNRSGEIRVGPDQCWGCKHGDEESWMHAPWCEHWQRAVTGEMSGL